jgi:hypothetical protein
LHGFSVAKPAFAWLQRGEARRRVLQADFITPKPAMAGEGGVCWTKFETISSKIQMIKTTNADEAGRNNLSGGMDSPCLG